MMKNWLLALLGSSARAIDATPRMCGRSLNSAWRSGSCEPPSPVPLRIAALGHEARNHAVEGKPVVEALAWSAAGSGRHAAGATSGRSWTTTLPPLDSSSVQRLAGSAATSAGAINEADGLGGGSGAGFRRNQRQTPEKATQTSFFIILTPQPPLAAPTRAASAPAPALFPSLAATSSATGWVTNLSIAPP